MADGRGKSEQREREEDVLLSKLSDCSGSLTSAWSETPQQQVKEQT